ncbi:hypothetical protein FO519_005548 [Halicephalobus sp. NKZ332]|nr:hypothetical protein FO519_005548 [Halicephalobus sp. NKZ332]
MSLFPTFFPVLNQKAAKNRDLFSKNTSKTEVTEDGNRLKLAKGHIIEAKGLDALQFFSTHHDYRRGRLLIPGPEFNNVMYSNLAIECRDPRGRFLTPEQIDSFESLDVAPQIKSNIYRMGISLPLPVQCFLIPFLLYNKNTDILAVAPTGCGKTLAVVVPLVEHCIQMKKEENPRIRPLNAPFAVVIGATRDLVHQLQIDALRIAFETGIDVKCAYGEYDRTTNGKDIRDGCDILIATVGRFVDLVDKGDVLVEETRFIAVDEADKLVADEIFQDLMIVLNNRVRPDVTYALFSATFSSAVRSVLPRLMHSNFVQMVMHTNGISPLVKQIFLESTDYRRKEDILKILMKEAKIIPEEKLDYDVSNFVHPVQYDVEKTIIYAESRRVIDYLAIYFSIAGIRCISMHGGRSQRQRNEAYEKFKKSEFKVLVASNVAARGLNFPDVKQIINYDPPQDMETYIHRIGRAGRLGSVARAVTFLNPEDIQHMQLAAEIIEELRKLNQEIPDFLKKMANMVEFGCNDPYVMDFLQSVDENIFSSVHV